jgi:hypothetical protein
MSVRIVATIFTVVMIYAAFCSTGCIFGVCPYQGQESTSHDFDHPSSCQHPGVPHQHDHGSRKSDCAAHHHPTFNVNSANFGHFQLTSTGQTSINDLLVARSVASRIGFSSSLLSHLGSPPILKNSLYQQTSVLRI